MNLVLIMFLGSLGILFESMGTTNASMNVAGCNRNLYYVANSEGCVQNCNGFIVM